MQFSWEFNFFICSKLFPGCISMSVLSSRDRPVYLDVSGLDRTLTWFVVVGEEFFFGCLSCR